MFAKILIAVDESSCAERAGRTGLEFAKKIGAKVLVTHVVKSPPSYMGLKPSPKAIERYLENLLGSWKELGQQMKLDLMTEHFSADDIAEGILFAARRAECDLIVMGTHGREGLPRVFLGSVAERVSRLSPIPLMLVRGDGPATPIAHFGHILAPLDGSEVGRPAFALADQLSTELGAELQILHVVPPLPAPVADLWGGGAIMYNYALLDEEAKKEGQAILAAAKEQAKSPKVGAEMVEALFRHVSEVIVEYARQHHSDLIVMGTHGRTGFERFLLGSVAEGVIHHAPVPVLLVRAAPVAQTAQAKAVQGANQLVSS
jgi:nucleotide-binding universal stress UspA family protein